MPKQSKRRLNTRRRRSGFLVRPKLVILTLVVIVTILFNSTFVRADVSYFYSPLCLGGWKFSNNVEGEPQLPPGADTFDFNSTNSAVLNNSNAQIFCGKFTSNNQPPENITGMRLRLSLGIITQPQEVPATDFESGNTLDAPPEQPQTFIIVPLPEEVLVPSEIEKFESTRESEPVESPVSEPLPVEQPQPSQEPTETESSLWNFFIPSAYAQSGSGSPEDILQITYSQDGETWYNLGVVNKNNWQGQGFELPGHLINELGNLQISISPLFNLDGKDTVYLDSMWIEVEYNSGLTDFILGIGDTILDTLTLQNVEQLVEEVTVSPSPPVEPVVEKVKTLEYKFDTGSEFKAKTELSWYDRETYEKAKGLSESVPYVRIRNGSNDSLLISGQCREKYFVVLAYREKDDYDQSPNSYVYNSAFPCEGGIINHKITEFPNVEAGEYHLLVGEQGNRAGWVPVSDITKINLKVIEKEVEKSL